jgi:hypothetical protein
MTFTATSRSQVFPLPHIRKPPPVQRGAGSVITDENFQGPWKKCVMTTGPVQRFETLLSDPWWKLGHIQGLVDRTCRCQFQLTDP